LPRPSASIIVRLRAGNAPLNGWLFWIKSPEVDSDLCDHCNQKEDLNHFFFLCRRFIRQHVELRRSMGSHNANSLYHLLATPEGICHALLYIKSTDRFPHMKVVVPPDEH
ncbi:hypothetical protein C8J56DRAFT_801658, partial [Mycena floridula]